VGVLAVVAALTAVSATTAAPVVSAATAPAAANRETTPDPSCPLASESPLTVDQPGQAPPAGPLLRRLASRLHAVPADTQTGRYAHAVLRMQAADSTLDGGPCVVTVTAYATEQRWRADDGSGHITAITWHNNPNDPPLADTTTYPAGGLPGVVAGPVPTDPTTLAAALDAAYPPIAATLAQPLAQSRPLRAADNVRQRRHTGTAARLRAVADLNSWHYTNRAARRAVLLVLADVAGLAYRGVVADYPGAIAVSADSGDWRDLLVIDPGTGVVLAYEQVLLRGGETTLGVHTPYSNTRTAYSDQGRTSLPGRSPRDV
jgi:hypothetical protein